MRLLKYLILITILSTTIFANPPRDDEEYLKPVATLFTSLQNCGWIQSATVNEEFSWSIGLPINIVTVGGADKAYQKSYQSGTYDTTYISPTIISDYSGAVIREPLYGLDGSVVKNMYHELSDGLFGLEAGDIIPFVTLQLGFSYKYTELKLRYIGAPTIENISVNFPGVGIQHDFGRSLIKKELPVDLSVFSVLSFTAISMEDEDMLGEMSGFAGYSGITVGKKVRNFEFFLETGWEYSSLDLLVDSEDYDYDLGISGRNNFKVALNISAKLGPWLPIISQSFASNFGNSINLISFKK